MNASDMLPFVVDSRFIPSGYEGDYLPGNITMTGDKTGAACGSRATTTAQGSCYAATYAPPLVGSKGFAAVVWQYPVNNFGASPGYLIPAGATKVVFYAKGKNGGEVVSFAVGQDMASVTTPCPDSVIIPAVPQTLTTTWTQYTIPLNGQTYAAGENSGFIWVATPQTPDAGAMPEGGGADATVTDAAPASDAAPVDAGVATGTPISFFIDDIKWTM